MSWLFSQALVEEYLAGNFSDGEQSVPLNGNNTQQAYCAPDKMTGFSRLSRFGMTYKPLTENRGEELLTLYREAFLAKTSQPQGGGGGIDGERSGMWREMARIIYEVQPRFVFVENSPVLTSRGLGRVLGDLAQMGFDAKWGVLGAADIGAPHQRDRIWIVGNQKMANTRGKRCNKRNNAKLEANKTIRPASPISIESSLERYNRHQWSAEPDVCRMVNGIPDTVDRLKALGNAQVPLCAATAWRILNDF